MNYVNGKRYQDKDGKLIEINRNGVDKDGTLWTSYTLVKNGRRSGPSRQSKTNALSKRFKEIAP